MGWRPDQGRRRHRRNVVDDVRVGDQGTLCLPAMRGVVLAGETYGEGNGNAGVQLMGTSTATFAMPSTPQSCSGPGSGGTQGWAGGLPEQLCTESMPCNANDGALGGGLEAVTLTTCDSNTGAGGNYVYGPTHVKVNQCDFNGGGGACEGDAGSSPSGWMCIVGQGPSGDDVGSCDCATVSPAPADPSQARCPGGTNSSCCFTFNGGTQCTCLSTTDVAMSGCSQVVSLNRGSMVPACPPGASACSGYASCAQGSDCAGYCKDADTSVCCVGDPEAGGCDYCACATVCMAYGGTPAP